MARGCARIDSRIDTAKIGSAGRVEVHRARMLAVIGVRKTFLHRLGQSRKCERLTSKSGLPPSTDIVRPPRHVSKVTKAEIAPSTALWLSARSTVDDKIARRQVVVRIMNEPGLSQVLEWWGTVRAVISWTRPGIRHGTRADITSDAKWRPVCCSAPLSDLTDWRRFCDSGYGVAGERWLRSIRGDRPGRLRRLFRVADREIWLGRDVCDSQINDVIGSSTEQLSTAIAESVVFAA